MSRPRRPRVAAIGLDRSQLESIAPLCGDLRPADSQGDYLSSYEWTETDVVASGDLAGATVAHSVNLLTIGPTSLEWSDRYSRRTHGMSHFATTDSQSKERELIVPAACPHLYEPLAADLARQLSQAADPPPVLVTSRKTQAALIETTSGRPVALRLVLPSLSGFTDDDGQTPIALLLPAAANLAEWFRAFLCDVHESDPCRVPQAPPSLSQPLDWYTPAERALADRISQIDSDIERLTIERVQRETELASEGERADLGVRQVLWADGDELVASAQKVLADLGFNVCDMDAERGEGEPKREDLRLTRDGVDGWEAMVEVKGYSSGTRTNDARQIREHRERYIAEERRLPDLTVWLANPYRTIDPSARPAPDQNVKDAAANIGAVHVLTTDLYRQWALVAAGSLDANIVVQSLVSADPGLWTLPDPDSGN